MRHLLVARRCLKLPYDDLAEDFDGAPAMFLRKSGPQIL